MLMDVRESRLANGVRVITSAMPRVESVTLGIWVGVGARYEAAKVSGASHFIEHLLFKGTKRRSARAISQAIEGYGGYLNAFTQEESTCYYARVSCDRAWNALDVLCDMYLQPLFKPADIDKERGVIIEEIMMYRDQPHHVVQEMLTECLWTGHALGRPIIGSPETLKAMDRGVLLGFKGWGYVPSDTVVSLAGKVDHESCVAQVERQLGALRRGRLPGCAPVTRGVGQEAMRLRQKESEQTHMAMGIRLFGRHDRRRYALKLLNVVLGENMSSRLFQVVREKHGLAYSVHSGFQLFEESGALVVSAGLDRKRTGKAVDLIIRELVGMKEGAVGPRELKRAKDYVVGQIRLGLESTSHQMMWLGDNLLSFGRFIPPEDVIRKVTAVTAEEVQAVAADILSRSRTSFAMISPETAKENGESRYRESLARLG